jgi:chromosomal replication initiation ATPase DnaA
MSNEEARRFMTDFTHFVADLFEVPASALSGPSRYREYMFPRMIILGLATTRYGLSTVQAGKYLGARHNSTVSYHLREFRRATEGESSMKDFVQRVAEAYDAMRERRRSAEEVVREFAA